MKVIKHLEKTTIIDLLQKSSSLITPPLLTEVDLFSYSQKLADNASFVVHSVDNKIVAYLAYYKNDKINQLYIPLICVSIRMQHKGIGSLLLKTLVDSEPSYGSIGLEVVKQNINAYNFYLREGFIIQEDRGMRYLMVKSL